MLRICPNISQRLIFNFLLKFNIFLIFAKLECIRINKNISQDAVFLFDIWLAKDTKVSKFLCKCKFHFGIFTWDKKQKSLRKTVEKIWYGKLKFCDNKNNYEYSPIRCQYPNHIWELPSSNKQTLSWHFRDFTHRKNVNIKPILQRVYDAFYIPCKRRK